MKIAILGAGGLGKAAAQIIEQKDEMKLVAVADAEGFIHAPQGVNAKDLLQVKAGGSVAALAGGESTYDSIGKVIELKDQVDGVFLALPNLPNNFIPGIVDRFLDSGFQGVFSDVEYERLLSAIAAKDQEGCMSILSVGYTLCVPASARNTHVVLFGDIGMVFACK